jgi:uncharacterized protein (DUF924 family)
MSWTYEWAANLRNMRSWESFLKLASQAGVSLPRSSTISAVRDNMERGTGTASLGQGSQSSAQAVVQFWREAGPDLWFAKNDEFDRKFQDRFLDLHESAVRGELHEWLSSPYEALALLLLLDQFPRNAFRGSPRMYASDGLAREVAEAAIVAGHDRKVDPSMQLFFYLPFGHSENPADQERCVALSERLGEPDLSHARRHRDIVKRFGRFPHRNPILDRAMTPEEKKFLDEGGYSG